VVVPQGGGNIVATDGILDHPKLGDQVAPRQCLGIIEHAPRCPDIPPQLRYQAKRGNSGNCGRIPKERLLRQPLSLGQASRERWAIH
ncbi:hypothetical protein, partial [Klebsiella aerogenes]|uniref:hypothetical protein n=1 Tax=Klebsiella aerogenes TaxID=548 RepID=UPI0013D155A7